MRRTNLESAMCPPTYGINTSVNISMSTGAKKKPSKRPPMRTATDVINRILWDDKISQDLITIGYEDRFLGVLEKPFNDFSWEPLDSIDYHTFGIPKHRIQYFKYRDVVIWDKNLLLDNVFGSSGSGVTINDIVQEVNSRPQNATPSDYSLPSKMSNTDSDSEDDGVVLQLYDDNSMAVKVIESEGEEDDEDSEDVYWQNKLRPNFFICHRIDGQEFLEQAKLIQSHFRALDPIYDSCCIPPECLHMTLRTLRLDNAEQVAVCVRTLKEAQNELKALLPHKPLSIQGIGNFHDRVIYAAVQPDDQLSDFVDHLDLVLHSSGLRLADGRDFVPHVTLVKLTRPVARQLGTNRIDPALYERFEETSFGSQTMNAIYLCSMEKTRDANGFYVSPANVTFMKNVI